MFRVSFRSACALKDGQRSRYAGASHPLLISPSSSSSSSSSASFLLLHLILPKPAIYSNALPLKPASKFHMPFFFYWRALKLSPLYLPVSPSWLTTQSLSAGWKRPSGRSGIPPCLKGHRQTSHHCTAQLK